MWTYIFLSPEKIPGNGIVGSYVRYIVNFSRNHQTIFQSDYHFTSPLATFLHIHANTWNCWSFLLSFYWCVVLICVSLTIKVVEDIFRCPLAIHTPFLDDMSVQIICALKKMNLFILLSCKLFVHSRYKFFIRYIIYKCFISAYTSLFIFLRLFLKSKHF